MLKRLTLTALLVVLCACSGDPTAAAAAKIKRGDALLAQGKLQEATVDYLAAVQLNPTSAEARQKAAELKQQGYQDITFTNASTGKTMKSIKALLRDDAMV